MPESFVEHAALPRHRIPRPCHLIRAPTSSHLHCDFRPCHHQVRGLTNLESPQFGGTRGASGEPRAQRELQLTNHKAKVPGRQFGKAVAGPSRFSVFIFFGCERSALAAERPRTGQTSRCFRSRSGSQSFQGILSRGGAPLGAGTSPGLVGNPIFVERSAFALIPTFNLFPAEIFDRSIFLFTRFPAASG